MYSVDVVYSGNRKQGFLSQITQAEGWTFASGGTYHRTTFLVSEDAATFRQTSHPQCSGLRGVLARAVDDVIVVGEYGRIAITRDQGKTWDNQMSGVNHCLYRICEGFGALWATGDGGAVLRSDDEGQTWSHARKGGGRLLATFVQSRRAFFFGVGMHLYDGERFEEVETHAVAPLTGMVEAPDGALILIGDRGQVFRSEDGREWARLRVPSNVDFEDIAVLDEGLVIVGASGTVLQSDDGQSWQVVDLKLSDHLWCLHPTEGGALVGCAHGKILRFTGSGSGAAGADDWEDLD